MMMKKLFFTLLAAALFTACADSKAKVIQPAKAEDLSLYYEMLNNGNQGKDQSLNQFTLSNNGAGELAANWVLYFNQTRTIVDNSVKGDVQVTRINGDFYKVEPSKNYKALAAKGKLTFTFETNAWIIKNADFPCGFYLVFKDSLGKELPPVVLSNVSYAPLTKATQTNRVADDGTPIPTAESRYESNKIISELAEGEYCPIIPTPASYKKGNGEFKIDANTVIYCNKEAINEAKYLQSTLKKLLRSELAIREGKGTGTGIFLNIGTFKIGFPKIGGYELGISNNGVEIKSGCREGIFNGIQSLRALIPIEAYKKKLGSVKVGAVQITDAPRFEYRGMFLDVARNFQSKESVMKLLDLMSFYKLNKFHFHLMDDEGWRLQIAALPELTDVGSKRGHSKDEAEMLNPTCGSGPFADAKQSSGTGFYSKTDFIEILKYATDRHIEVIPELDFPGHARAAIVSMKARYNKYIKSDAKKANEYLLHDPNDASKYHTEQHYNDNVICIAQESTYHFLDTLVGAISQMYQEAGITLKMVHTGGDEVPHPTLSDPESGAWVKSPICVEFMKNSATYKNPRDLFYYYVNRFNKILTARNITTGGWEEIGLRKQIVDSVEVIAPNLEFSNAHIVPYIWNTVWGWGNEDRGYKLANANFKIVLSNVSNLYFDLANDKDPLENGYYWGGFVDLRKVWSFVPLNIGKGINSDRMGHALAADYMKNLTPLTAKGKNNVLGIQGQLWSETVKKKETMEYMIFPRLIALAERAWAADPAWTAAKNDDELKKQSDVHWNSFVNTLGKRDLPRLEYLCSDNALNYRIPLPGAKIEHDSLYANIEIPGFEILYTTEPNKAESWKKYSGPVLLSKGSSVALKARNAKGRESRQCVVKSN